jgi:enoyl-CoA hydratase/carnithine racemase
MWTGDFFGAHEALGMGIVNRVVPHDDLMKEARQFARRLAEGPSLAIDMMKHLITAGEKTDFQTLVELEMYVVGIHANTDDFKESTRAFVEKRSPVFKGT